MISEDIFNETKDAYLLLIHPKPGDEVFRQRIAQVIALAPSVPDEVIAEMIICRDWRDRILGLCVAMGNRPGRFVDVMLESLRNPRGIAIVPACAALSLLAIQRVFAMPESFSVMFDRTAYDGELGWASDKAMYIAGLRSEDAEGRGPNYAQIFDNHLELYRWVHPA